MNDQQKCPECECEYAYFDATLWVCPECAHEWSLEETSKDEESGVRDVNGNLLEDGDAVTVIKDLKVKGSTSGVKSGTKVKNIRLIDGHDGHNISCKISGVGSMYLKSAFVKKA